MILLVETLIYWQLHSPSLVKIAKENFDYPNDTLEDV